MRFTIRPRFTAGTLQLETLFRFKGQAADCVVITEIDFDDWTDDVRRRLFVALTRARGPESSDVVSVGLRALWRQAPAAVVGCLYVGLGSGPLTEDNSVRSRSALTSNLRISHQVNRQTSPTLDVFNLFDRKASDIDYFYASRLRGEAAGGVAEHAERTRHWRPARAFRSPAA